MGAGAIPDHFRGLAGELAKRGHEVILVTWGTDAERHFGPEGIPLERFPSPRPTRWRDIQFLARLMRKQGTDCVIANFGASNAAAVAGLMARVPVRIDWYHTRLGQILRDRGGVDFRFVLQFVRKRLVFTTFTRIVANAGATAEELRRVWRIPPRKICTLWYASKEPPADLLGVQKAPGKVVCAGRLHPSKGQATLIEALGQRAADLEGVTLHLLGDGGERAKLEELARRCGLEGRVVFRGAVSREEVLREMASAEVTVVPSLDEAFGLVNIESMSVGTPVVASRVGGIPEIVRDGVDGFLFEPGNDLELGDRLLEVLSDRELREQMGRNARRRFLEEFESSLVAKRQADWLEGLVAAVGRRGNG